MKIFNELAGVDTLRDEYIKVQVLTYYSLETTDGRISTR